MSEIITLGQAQFQRKIRCPGHYLIPPNIDIYKREPVERLKDVSKSVVEKFKIKTMRRAKDALGRPIIDWKKLYELRRQGIVKQPEVTAAFAIENIYDPLSELCRMCDKRCKRGQGTINELGIKRLHG